MRNIKTKAAVLTIAATMLLTACSNGEGTSSPNFRGEGSSSGNTSMEIPGIQPSESVKKLGMWDVLPEIPVTDASAFTYEYDSKLGGMVVTDYLRESPKVRIPDTLEGEPVVEVHLGIKKEITELIMPDSVIKFGLSETIIGSLQYVNIPKSISKGVVPYMAFQGGVNLISVYLPDSVTAIDTYAFDRCYNVAITYKGKTYDPEHLYLLYDYFELGGQDLIIENGVLKDVSEALTEVVIPDGVTEIDAYAFSGCQNLTSVTIPDSMTEIGDYTFNDCASLISVTIPDSVTEIGDYTFNDCASLTSVTIPDSVTKIGSNAFRGCESLISVTIPDGVTEIGNGAFYNCSSLTSVTIPDGVAKIDSSAFEGCTSITSITYQGKTFENIYQVTDYIELGGLDLIIENGVLKDVPRGLTEVVIPDNVTEIGEEAFLDCASLTSVTIPNSVTKIGNSAFQNCDNLTSVTIPDSVTEIGDTTFYNCKNLKGVTIPNGVTKIGKSAFGGCSSLTSVTIPDSVTEIGIGAFNDCTSLTSITIPDSVTKIDERVFSDCTRLKSVTIPGSVTEIGESAFSGCTSLTSITIPDSVTKIGKNAFFYCTRLKSVTIPDSVTKIGENAFWGCENIVFTYKGGTYGYNETPFLYND